MSRDDLHRRFEGWLASERSGDEARAERALRWLYAALPLPAPSTGFADRALAACTVPPPVVARWALERFAAGLLLYTLLLVWILPHWLAVAWRLLGAPDLWVLGAVLRGAARGFAGVVTVWGQIAQKARLAEAVLATPEAQPLLLVSALMVAGFGGLLYHLLEQRSSVHVEARG